VRVGGPRWTADSLCRCMGRVRTKCADGCSRRCESFRFFVPSLLDPAFRPFEGAGTSTAGCGVSDAIALYAVVFNLLGGPAAVVRYARSTKGSRSGADAASVADVSGAGGRRGCGERGSDINPPADGALTDITDNALARPAAKAKVPRNADSFSPDLKDPARA